MKKNIFKYYYIYFMLNFKFFLMFSIVRLVDYDFYSLKYILFENVYIEIL